MLSLSGNQSRNEASGTLQEAKNKRHISEFDLYDLGHRRSSQTGDRYQYINGLEDVKELLKGHTEPVVLHTDQGSVYASKAYNDLIKDSVIVRSMSRSGKPTDNPVNESINGWMKEELFMDFKIEECRRREEFAEVLERYVDFYNNRRPCYAIGYDTPVNYRKRYYRGEIERKNTFEGRSLTEEPKFVAKRRKQAHAEGVSTLKKEKWQKMHVMSTFEKNKRPKM